MFGDQFACRSPTETIVLGTARIALRRRGRLRKPQKKNADEKGAKEAGLPGDFDVIAFLWENLVQEESTVF